MANFLQFDVVADASDHEYVGSNLGGKQCTEAVTKKIMKEWKIFEKSLPDSIFVRGYEDRIDLLRAVIIGPPGTPYYNMLFFFDICFPNDYPHRPPLVKYKSFGMRLNPNLYASGYVCLSLLNTWLGGKAEKWNPSQSTILQVLLSLQALVLNEKPYFNEPGFRLYAGISSWEKKSLAYSEQIWLKSCITIIYLVSKPPKHFEEFVTHHFQERASTILLACKAYISGHAKVGNSVQTDTIASAPVYKVSKKFRKRMLELYPKLLNWFAYIGLNVESFRIELQSLLEAEKRDNQRENKICKALKKIFGCATAPQAQG